MYYVINIYILLIYIYIYYVINILLKKYSDYKTSGTVSKLVRASLSFAVLGFLTSWFVKSIYLLKVLSYML